MQGPFSQAMNAALLRRLAQKLVTKDTGVSGGFAEKVAAAERSAQVSSTASACGKRQNQVEMQAFLADLPGLFGKVQRIFTIIGAGMARRTR